MCNFKGNLVTWIDGELSSEAAADVERHLKSCGECRLRLAKYEGVSRDFASYYMAKAQPLVVPANRIPRWVPYVAAAAAIMLVASALAVRPSHKSLEVRDSAKIATSAAAKSAEPVPSLQDSHQMSDSAQHAASGCVPGHDCSVPAAVHSRKVATHHGDLGNGSQTQQSEMAASAIQIAIPAEAVFPPGAVPEGVAYIASLAPDGSIQSIRLQP